MPDFGPVLVFIARFAAKNMGMNNHCVPSFLTSNLWGKGLLNTARQNDNICFVSFIGLSDEFVGCTEILNVSELRNQLSSSCSRFV